MQLSIPNESPPLPTADCFSLLSADKPALNTPSHYHEEYELTYIENGKGAQRIVGSSMEEIDNLELVLIGPHIPHAWATHKCQSGHILEIVIQFHKALFPETFIKRPPVNFIHEMFCLSRGGLTFSPETIRRIAPRLKALDQKGGFASVLELMSILHELSVAPHSRALSTGIYYDTDQIFTDRQRILLVLEFINVNFTRTIHLSEAAEVADMAKTYFRHFFKIKTGITFVGYLDEVRIGHATRMLIGTTKPVAEIAIECGFTNTPNFNRIFKKRKGIAPREFRDRYGK